MFAPQPPVTRMPYWVRRRIFQREVALSDFSGGLNRRDAPIELANNESPDCLNVTLNEKGGAEKRLGHVKKNSSPFTTSHPPQAGGFWATKGIEVTQCGADLFKDNGTASVHTFSTAARVGFAEFGSAYYAIHPIDGLFSTTDAITWSAVSSSPKGTAIEPWQTRLLAIGDPGAPTTVYASAIGDATDWATGAGHGWTNKILEHDSEPLVGIKAASGVDIAGKPGVLVCKNHSTYRINDSNTGAYQTIDTSVGAASALAITNLNEITYILHQTGIYQTNGVSALTLASGKLQPIFTALSVAYDQLPLYCAGSLGDRVHFSLPTVGQTANTLHLEYHPVQGWIVPHTDAVTHYVTNTTTGKLHGGAPAVNGQVYEMFSGGSDDGAAIACRFWTKWLAPIGGIEARFRRVRVSGRGNFSLYVRRDFDTGAGTLYPVSLATGNTWGGTTWGGGLWGSLTLESATDFWSLGQGSYISFGFVESSTLTATTTPLPGVAASETVGAFACYSLILQHIPLSL